MSLQDWFYTLGIIYMALSLLFVIAMLTAVLVIKAKIDHLHRAVNEKIDKVRGIADKGSIFLRTVKHFVGR
jgi:hypothetical protein